MTSAVIKPHNNFLKCSICGCPLSITPIFYNSALGSVCGRCENIREEHSEKTFERQIIYEMFMKNCIFPCAFKNQGCLAELNWDTAFIHEQMCLFRVTTVLCPLFHERFCEWCTWIDDYSKLSEHMRNQHKKYFSETLTLTLTPELENKILFSEINNHLLMVLLDNRIKSNNIVCSIMSDMSYKQCLENKFVIHFSAKDAEQVIFEGEQLEHLSPSTQISPEYNLTIPVSSFEHLFKKCGEIRISISILPKGKMNTNSHVLEIGSFQNKVSEAAELTTAVLNQLECPICTELMGPPIYMCIEGHSMCGRCRYKILECPVCRGHITGGRNITLEKLSSIVTGPCEYRKDGCSYINTISKVKAHEPFCYLAIRNCIINICEWNGRTLELPQHLEEEHSFRDISRSYSFKLGTISEQHMFLYEDKIILMNLCSAENQPLSYSIQCLGGTYLQYYYEIELIDPTIETNKIVLRNACQPVGYNFNKNSFLLLSIPVEMFDWLVKDNEINFKVNIHDISD